MYLYESSTFGLPFSQLVWLVSDSLYCWHFGNRLTLVVVKCMDKLGASHPFYDLHTQVRIVDVSTQAFTLQTWLLTSFLYKVVFEFCECHLRFLIVRINHNKKLLNIDVASTELF